MRNRFAKRGSSGARSGYLLVTVLVMIGVVSLLLSQIAASSMRVASSAIAEEREMRNRWAVTSVRRFCLDSAPRLLELPSSASGETLAPSILWKDVSVAEQTFRVILADETAKLNLRKIASQYGESTVATVTEELLSDHHGMRSAVGLGASGKPSGTRWENWVADGGTRSLLDPRKIAAATQRLTLWGDGRLNVFSSDEETLEALWRQLFGRRPPNELLEARSQSPRPPLGQLLTSLDLRESQAVTARRWLVDESECYSVWIFCQSDRQVPSSLYVEWGGRSRGGAVSTATNSRGYEY